MDESRGLRVGEPFNGNNFETWKFRLELLLRKESLLDHITANPPSVRNRTEQWLQNDARAMFILSINVKDEFIAAITGCETARSMFQALSGSFTRESELKMVDLRDELFTMKFSPLGNVKLNEYLVKFKSTAVQLRALGDQTPVRQMILRLLRTLPADYRPIKTVLENQTNLEDNSTSWQKVISAILNFEKELLMEKEETSASAASSSVKEQTDAEKSKSVADIDTKVMFTGNGFARGHRNFRRGNSQRNSNRGNGNGHRGNGQRGSYNRGQNRFSRGRNIQNIQCRFCGRFGHYERDCWDKKRNEKSSTSQGKNQEGANLASGSIAVEYPEVSFFIPPGSSLVDMEQNVYSNEVGFYMDSGASYHMSDDLSLFEEIVKLKSPFRVYVAKTGVYVTVTAIGNVRLFTDNGRCVLLKNVRFSEELSCNLISVSRLDKSGLKVEFFNGKAEILTQQRDLIFVAHLLKNNLYRVFFCKDVSKKVNVIQGELMYTDSEKWHHKLAHLNFNDMLFLKNCGLINGHIKKSFCEPCIFGKQHRKPFEKRKDKTKRPLDLIHTDVCGPINPVSYDGKRFFVTFIDDYSGFCHAYLMSSVTEVLSKFKEFSNYVCNKFDRKIKRLRCDRGTEYTNNAFQEYCKDQGISFEPTIGGTPQQNGKAERWNRSIVERARTVLYQSGLDKIFWSEAVAFVVYVLNRCPTSKNIIPFSCWNCRDYDYSKLQVFGCDAYKLDFVHSSHKLDEKSMKLKFVGYAPGGYRLLDVDERKIHLSRDVDFNVNNFSKDINYKGEDKIFDEIDLENIHDIPISDNSNLCFQLWSDTCPQSFEEAVNSPESQKWKDAMRAEIEALNLNNSWKFVERPQSEKIVSCRWVFTKKYNSENNVIYKARLVARGFEQENIFNSLYSPVAKMSTIRTLLAISNVKGFYIHCLDFCNAFLNGLLEEEVYLEIPEGTKQNSSKVLLLKKALYGLKQAPKLWNQEFNSFICKLGFYPSKADRCLYIKKLPNNDVVYLAIYVDDIILSSANLDTISEIKRVIGEKYKCKDLGEIRSFLGLSVNYNRNEAILQIDQEKMIERVAEKFRVSNCNNVLTPMEEKLVLHPCKDPKQLTKYPYRELIGSLMYLMLGTRPDICFAVSFFSQFQDSATDIHFQQLLRVLKYVYSTRSLKLTYTAKNLNSEILSVYSDADWANCMFSRRSFSGCCAFVFGNLVSWSCRKQSLVALSSTESEIIALCECTTEAVWLQRLVADFNYVLNSENAVIYGDNQNSLRLVTEGNWDSKRSKHIDTKFRFVCDVFNNNYFNYKYKGTEYQIADLFTKSLGKVRFLNFRSMLSLI